ncbi:hypothetical protein L596_023080 [Steinernema carpocapsae]|uniref:Uncharacterized protein n=1 Tax=Steinernema carpocapsae TaxID=34508 RepID=A0A4U5MCK1_STECR|nr:hypothetical protein L596_023080 [Steinernema carpocapsae]
MQKQPRSARRRNRFILTAEGESVLLGLGGRFYRRTEELRQRLRRLPPPEDRVDKERVRNEIGLSLRANLRLEERSAIGHVIPQLSKNCPIARSPGLPGTRCNSVRPLSLGISATFLASERDHCSPLDQTNRSEQQFGF